MRGTRENELAERSYYKGMGGAIQVKGETREDATVYSPRGPRPWRIMIRLSRFQVQVGPGPQGRGKLGWGGASSAACWLKIEYNKS